MLTRAELVRCLEDYSSASEAENIFAKKFIDLLKHPDAFQRTHLPGHLTGSAWITDNERKHILLVHHAKLNRWLQPGGHADGDENIVKVARKEAEEETGLKKIILANPLFDIDIHSIPERKDFPQHDHYDIRCLFIADKNDPLLLSEESHAVKWFSIDEVEGIVGRNDSILRMVSKTR